jgi:hypothetical protein
MRNDLCVGWVVMTTLVAVAATADAGAAESKRSNVIKILEATYGGNCESVKAGNLTQFVASACDSKDLCNYRVYYKQLGGDPAEGCEKSFAVSYICGRNTKRNACTLPPEAGKGGEEGQANNFCLLHCLATSDSPKARPAVAGETSSSETDGSNPLEAQQAKPPTIRSDRPTSRDDGEGRSNGRGFDEVW